MNAGLALAVFVGAGLGGVLRWQVGALVARWLGASFPWGTLIVNVSGSAVMGVLAALFMTRTDEGLWQTARLFMLTGVLGGYTTFSTFSLETIALWERGAFTAAAAYCFGSVVLSFAGLWIGLVVARSFS
ncbi:fluoride efflux transporter CrcB [Pseudochelatococcus contaminans]|uniref:Fluoride-specific ion channel FluC n=1 Tax=Pseudochelatococcus contaminans TaxID=1538103 RepID=A0A7W5Z6V7_9HYPH|nr:fluoride efflux transporter CrcB [Pseudochelatococcus contaminans]MBB3810782.1 CrcB protein [Pseudochelatococcus contaminans]